MERINRRDFIKLLSVAAAAGMAGFPLSGVGAGKKGRVVVIGGGYGGAIAAKYLRMADPGVEVTLIEKDKAFVSCPLSNEVLSGERTMASLTFDYKGLQARGIKVVHDLATEIDTQRQTVKTQGGASYAYDRLVVSPGVDFKWGAIEGYDEAASQVMPHAWKAGPQTLLLRKQIMEMADGGTVTIVAPPNPFRCPPGPYERAAQIAWYLKHNKPKSKVVILDAKDAFSKQGLFLQGWQENYPGMIEWVSAAKGGTVVRVDARTRTLFTELEEHKSDVVSVIPPQKAGRIAELAGLTDKSGWCPVNPMSFESTLQKNIHVIGDACIATPMPKSGYAANTQAKVCAAAIVAILNGQAPPDPAFTNTCYSLITPEYGISVAGIYQVVDGKIVEVKNSGGVSPAKASAWERKTEAELGKSWFLNVTADMFT